MWFCTAAGVSCFNGYTFKNYTTHEGLSDNFVFGAFEDSKGRIWFRTLSGKLCYYYQDSIYKIGANSKINLSSKNSYIGSLYVDSGDTLWCGVHTVNQVFKIKPGYTAADFSCISSTVKALSVQIIENKGIIWSSGPKVDSSIRVIKNVDTLTLAYPKFFSSRVNAIALSKKENILFGFHDLLVSDFSSHSLHAIFSPPNAIISSIYVDEDCSIFITDVNSGLYIFKNGDFNKRPVHYLKGYRITSIYKDKEDGFWVTTFAKGVLYIPAINLLSYNNEMTNKDVVTLNCINDSTLLVSMNVKDFQDNFTLISNDTVLKKIPVDSYPLNKKIKHKEKFTAIGGQSLNRILLYDRKKQIINYIPVKGETIANLCYDKEGDIAIGTFNYLLKIDAQTGQTKSLVNNLPFRTYAIATDKNNVLWFGTTNGLWSYRNGKFNYWAVKNRLLLNTIIDIKIDKNDLCWMATREEGVLVKKGDSIMQVRVKDGLASNICECIFLDKNNTVWVGTNKGVSKIILEKWGKYSIQNFAASDGLIADEVSQINRCGNKLYIGTYAGLSVFDPDLLVKSIYPPPVYIKEFSVNDHIEKRADSAYSFTYKQNFISIAFIGICYHKIGKLVYKYRLKGLDTIWRSTANTTMQYTSLNPGNYVFEVLAVTDDGLQSKQPATLTFTIGNPFWLKWWFVTLAVLATLLVIVLIYNLRITAIKKSEQEKTLINKQIADIELKALRAQMNPHFIFNSINSIQHFILDNDRLSAQKYLAKFARLIRNVMENSKHEYVLLAHELQTLKLYIELEMLRASFSFTYELEVAENIYTEKIVIPPLVLQPYVENAILHGIVPLKHKNGKIRIKIEKSGASLKCIIDDNGIGRKLAMEYKAKKQGSHQSMGLSITKERLDILNQTGINKLSIAITDKYDAYNNAKGTTIELFMPLVEKEGSIDL